MWTYYDAVRVPSLVLAKFFPAAKTGWTNIDAISRLTYGIRAFDAYRVSEVAAASIALNL